MKITMKSFFMAALALMTVACSSNDENNFAQQPKTGEGITITAQLAPKSGNAATRALVDKSSYIESKWAVDEHLAILYEVSGTKYAADARITAVDGTTGAATIEFTVNGSTADNTPCTLIYPLSAANNEHTGLKDVGTLLGTQDGTLNANLDVRMGAGTIHTTNPGLTVTTQPEAQFAIFKFTTKNAEGSADINVKPLTITTGVQDFVITPASAKNELYAALPPFTSQTVNFVAKGSNGHTYSANFASITFSAGKYYQSVIKMTADNTIDLSSVTENTTAQNGDVLTGTLGANVKISIADNATVTLLNININGTNDVNYPWAGLTCEGDATITLADGSTNSVKGFYSGYPGIYVPSGKTLIIKGETSGTGSLAATSNGTGAGIGGGGGITCGNIEIQGGTINATGGANGAGIGSGSESSCGAISITGGTIDATGGDNGAGIGSGYNGHCTSVTIAKTVKYVEASQGANANNVGPGLNGTCGTVTIDNKVYWDGTNYQNDGEQYLHTNNVLLYQP